MREYKVDFNELNTLVADLRKRILLQFFGGTYFKEGGPLLPQYDRTLRCFPVPRGGVPVALALCGTMSMMLVDEPDHADFIVDDLIDTGWTEGLFVGKPFFALIDKRTWEHGRDFVVWPWEGNSVGGIETNITRLLQYIGEDPKRGGLAETPTRVAKAWEFWCSGYDQDIAGLLKTFEDGAEGCDEMVVVKDIPFYTHCEHHMAPFFGTATIAYLPRGKIVGLSKLNRVLTAFARRLQVQERLTAQVADALMQHLDPIGAGVVLKARHLCMESRGVCQQGHHTVTSALRGVFKADPAVRAEFLALAR